MQVLLGPVSLETLPPHCQGPLLVGSPWKAGAVMRAGAAGEMESAMGLIWPVGLIQPAGQTFPILALFCPQLTNLGPPGSSVPSGRLIVLIAIHSLQPYLKP